MVRFVVPTDAGESIMRLVFHCPIEATRGHLQSEARRRTKAIRQVISHTVHDHPGYHPKSALSHSARRRFEATASIRECLVDRSVHTARDQLDAVLKRLQLKIFELGAEVTGKVLLGEKSLGARRVRHVDRVRESVSIEVATPALKEDRVSGQPTPGFRVVEARPKLLQSGLRLIQSTREGERLEPGV